MSKKYKTLLIVYCVLCYIMAAVCLTGVILLLFNIGGLKDLALEILREIGYNTSGKAKLELTMTIIGLVVSVLVCVYCGSFALKYAKAKSMLIGLGQIIRYMGIFQILFLESCAIGIYAFLISYTLQREEQQVGVGNNLNTSKGSIEEQILEMKQQLENGKITQEQYNKYLSDAIEQLSKTKEKEQNFNKDEKSDN